MVTQYVSQKTPRELTAIIEPVANTINLQYFESELDNPIENAEQLFDQSFEATKGVSGGKPVWMVSFIWTQGLLRGSKPCLCLQPVLFCIDIASSEL
jgi:hypothetical protein